MLIIFILRVFLESVPTRYESSRHHGRPKSGAHSVEGKGGGMWTNLPLGQYGMVQPVSGSTYVRICQQRSNIT